MRKIDTKKLEQIRQKYELELVMIHGSQATGQVHAKSDVDVAVTTKGREGKVARLELIADLNMALATSEVDLTVLDKADPLLLKTVTDTAIRVAGAQTDFFKLKLLAFHRYNDYLPYLELERQVVRSQL